MTGEIAAALLFALREGPLGRRTLAARTGIGESTVRTQLNRLENRGWVTLSKAGTALSAAGREAIAPLLEAVLEVAEVRLEGLALGPCQLAAGLRGATLPPSWALRDRAVQAGAQGALVLRRTDRWVLADDGTPLRPPAAERVLSGRFPVLIPGDALLVAFAADRGRATRGLWRMVLTTLTLKEVL